MRIRLLLVMAIFLFATDVFAQSKAEKQVAMAVDQLKDAMVSGEKSALDDITSDRLSYGHSNGRTEDKSAFIEAFVSGRSDFISIELSNQTITVKGKTAFVRHQLTANVNDNGVPNQIKLHILTVWVKENGKWILLARQSVKI